MLSVGIDKPNRLLRYCEVLYTTHLAVKFSIDSNIHSGVTTDMFITYVQLTLHVIHARIIFHTEMTDFKCSLTI